MAFRGPVFFLFLAALVAGSMLADISPVAASRATGAKAGPTRRIMMDKKTTASLDVAPFATVTTDGTTRTLRWEEPRDIARIVLSFDGPAPRGDVRVDYRRQHWPGNRITASDLQKGAGGALGWRARDDWFNGEWKRSQSVAARKGRQITIAFAPLGETEFPELAREYNVAFRETNQLRIVLPPDAPPVSAIQVFTDTPLERREVAVEANCAGGDGATTPPAWRWETARVEVYNGVLESFNPPTAGDPRAKLRFLCARPAPFSEDKTIVTLRADGADGTSVTGFSFRPDDLDAAPHSIWIPDLGMLISAADGGLRFHDGPTTRLLTGRSTYDRVAEQPEQSLTRALRDMPPKKPMHFIVGCEGRRQKLGVEPGGDLFAHAGYVRRVQGADTPRLLWPGDGFRLKLFWDGMVAAGRDIEAGCLPMVRSRRVLRDLEVEQEVFATVTGDIAGPVKGDDAVVAMMRLTFRNRGTTSTELAQRFAFKSRGMGVAVGWDLAPSDEDEKLTLDGDRIGFAGPPAFTWALVREEGNPSTSGVLSLAQDGRSVTYSAPLAAGASRSLVVQIPFLAPTDAEISALRAKRFSDERTAVRNQWMRRLGAGAEMQTGIADIDDFWRSHVTHVFINDDQEPGCDRLVGRVFLVQLRQFLERVHHAGDGPRQAWLPRRGAAASRHVPPLPGHGCPSRELRVAGRRVLRFGRLRAGRLQPAPRVGAVGIGRALPDDGRPRLADGQR